MTEQQDNSVCPEHKVELKEVDIVKYNKKKVLGINLFCPKEDCKFEVDVNVRKEESG